MPRPDKIPVPRKSTASRFLRAFKWLIALSAVVTAIAVLLVARGDGALDWNVLVATGLGVFFTMLLGTTLMMLTFLSSRSGHDEEVARTTIEEDQ